MASDNKNSVSRSEVAVLFAVVLGIVIGTLIKKVRIGIVIGLVLGIMIVLSGWLRATRSTNENRNR